MKLKVEFLVLPNTPGSSCGPPRCQSGDTMQAKLQIWVPKSTASVSRNAKNLENLGAIGNGQEAAAEGVASKMNYKTRKI